MARLRPETAGQQSGVALVAVLGFLAAMSLIAVGIVGAARTAATGASRELMRAQAQAAVESGIDHAIGALLAGQGMSPSILARPEGLVVSDFRVEVSVRPERAKVDLNFGDANLLATLFRSGGADAQTAETLAAAVEDWRDGDDLARVNGAERRQYEEAGVGHRPANAFFTASDELRLVLGVDVALYNCIRPETTVFSQSAGIDIDVASPAIRRAAGVEVAPGLTAAGTPVAPRMVAAGEVFEITARLDDRRRGVRRSERAIVRLTGDPSDPYWVLSVEPAAPLEDAQRRDCPAGAASR